jgi:uncharacterized protein YodC (DUF2158 family)
MEFTVGDIVRLKSGSVTMTVEVVTQEGVAVVWMEGKKILRDRFPAGVLTKNAPVTKQTIITGVRRDGDS